MAISSLSVFPGTFHLPPPPDSFASDSKETITDQSLYRTPSVPPSAPPKLPDTSLATSLPFHRCCCSVTESCPALPDPADCSTQAPLSSTVSGSLLRCMSIELVMLPNHLLVCCPFPLLPSVFPSMRVFPNESVFCWIQLLGQVHHLCCGLQGLPNLSEIEL